MSSFSKDPDEVKDYGFDWADALAGDTIATSTWQVPTGLTEDSKSNNTTTTTIVLSGGIAGEIYKVTNRVVTVGLPARTLEESLTIRCLEA